MKSGIDLGIEGRTALVCGSSAGLGKACAQALLESGCDVFINGRDAERLELTAAELFTATGRRPGCVTADVTTASGRQELVGKAPSVDILVNNAAGPPTGQLEDWTEDQWHTALTANMVAPIMLIKAYIGEMKSRKWGRIINITSSSTKAPLPLLGLSNGARSGLTGFVGGLAREVAHEGVTINNLLPGRFATGRLDAYIGKLAASQGLEPTAMAAKVAAANPMKRFGRPREFGMFCAFLASEHAAYMTGQNILLDGGEFPGI